MISSYQCIIMCNLMNLFSGLISKEMVELRKAKELNDRLDLEIRALRNRVRFLDAEKNSLQQTVRYLLKKVFNHINPMGERTLFQDLPSNFFLFALRLSNFIDRINSTEWNRQGLVLVDSSYISSLTSDCGPISKVEVNHIFCSICLF